MIYHIRRGVDCVCDEYNYCYYHWNKIVNKGLIMGVIVSILIIGLMIVLSSV